MILKGNQRGGGQQLAAHLMNEFDNQVELADSRGTIAQDLSGAFAEIDAHARGTKCRKPFYSLSASPDPGQRPLTREEYFELLDRTERSLKLVGQPRSVVFHVKDGREHCHAVWSRIDTDKMKAVQIAHDRLKLRTVAKEFARDHGLELPEGLKKDGKRGRFNDRAKQESLAEKQQQERSGIPKHQRMADIATCWKETGNGAAFIAALEGKGYYLARGDQRTFVVVDLHGEVHSLSRQLKGVAKSKELDIRLDVYPLDKLPDVETAKDHAKQQREQNTKQKQGPSELDKRIEALKELQKQRRDDLAKQQTDLFARHLSEREGLRAMQEAQNTGIATARLARQPKGVLAFLTRITGIQMLVDRRHERQDQLRAQAHKEQAASLQRRHDREIHEAERRVAALARLEVRENKSVQTARQRDLFRQILERAREGRPILKPEFDRAASPQERTITGDDKPLTATFEKAGKPPIDLVEEFNREVNERIEREKDDRDLEGPDPFDPKRRR